MPYRYEQMARIIDADLDALGLVDSEGSTYLYAGGHRLVASRGHGAELSQAVTVQLDAPALIDTLL